MSGRWARGVMFDLDGTLYRLGFVKPRMTLRLLGSVRMLSAMGRARDSVRGRKFESREALVDAFCSSIARKAGSRTEEARVWFEEGFMRQFVAMLEASARPRPGLVALLERLNGAGVKLAVVSDFGAIRERLEALDVDPGLFCDLVATEEHGVLKPASEPFEALAEKWGIECREVLVVGDREDLDEASAQRSGMRFVGVLGDKKRSGKGYMDWITASREIEAHCGVGENK